MHRYILTYIICILFLKRAYMSLNFECAFFQLGNLLLLLVLPCPKRSICQIEGKVNRKSRLLHQQGVNYLNARIVIGTHHCTLLIFYLPTSPKPQKGLRLQHYLHMLIQDMKNVFRSQVMYNPNQQMLQILFLVTFIIVNDRSKRHTQSLGQVATAQRWSTQVEVRT